MSFCVAFFILEVVSQFLSDSELNTMWNRKKSCCSQGLWGSGSPWSNDPSYVTTLLKYISIFATPVRRTNDGASTGYKGCEEAVMAIFFFIKFNVEMIYLNGECRAIYPRLSRGHDFAGLFSTLGIKEIFKMALERPGNFIPKFWWY